MRKLLFLLLPLTSIAQRDSVKIHSPIFDIVYSEKLEQPLRVTYYVTCTDGKFSRAGLDFYTCDSVKTSDHLDYANNEFDKGHCAPAADFSCNANTLKATFSYLNCALQHQDLNRGTWRLLEENERNLAKQYGRLRVIITIEFKKPIRKLKTGASVPSGFFKEIYIEKTKQTFRYYMPNVSPKTSDFNAFLIK